MRVRHIFRLTTWKQGPGIRSKQDSLMSTFEYIEKIHCNNLRATKLQYPKLWYHSFKIQNYSVIQIRSCTKVSTPPEPLSTPAFEFWRPPTNLGSTLGPSPACVSKTSHSPTANPHCAWEFMFVGCFNSTTTWICNSETFNISWSQHSKKCRYTTKKWYLDEQFFFSPLWKTASLELVGPESWGPFFPPALSEKSWATLSHQKNSTVPIYLPTKLTRTHLNKLCFFKKKNIFPSSVSKKRQEKRKGGFLFFASCCFWAWPLGQPQRRGIWNLHQFFEPNSCGVLVLQKHSSSVTLTPAAKWTKWTWIRSLEKGKSSTKHIKTPIYNFQVPC